MGSVEGEVESLRERLMRFLGLVSSRLWLGVLDWVGVECKGIRGRAYVFG
jgi:hypothetical protein